MFWRCDFEGCYKKDYLQKYFGLKSWNGILSIITWNQKIVICLINLFKWFIKEENYLNYFRALGSRICTKHIVSPFRRIRPMFSLFWDFSSISTVWSNTKFIHSSNPLIIPWNFLFVLCSTQISTLIFYSKNLNKYSIGPKTFLYSTPVYLVSVMIIKIK